MIKQFDSRSAFITGAGGGIGRATAITFAREGAAVALADLNSEGIEETLHLIIEAGGKGVAIAADISDEGAVAAAFAEAVASIGPISLSVNNAGINQSTTLTSEITFEEWERVLSVNLTGTWLCMREELRHMVATGHPGAIVNVASLAGLRTLQRQTAYVSSKHAVVGLTKNAAVEYAAQGIRINAVAPGGIPTPMMEATLSGLEDQQRAAALAQVADFHPMNRLGSAEEIADAIMFLCSEKAGFITGTVLSVDGGWAVA